MQVEENKVLIDINKFATGTTLHGAKHISANYDAYTGFRGKKKRFLWSLVLVLNVVLLISLMNIIVTKLMWPEVTTKVELSWKTKAQFPAITLCNVNQFKRSFANESVQLRRILGEWYPQFMPYFFPNYDDWVAAYNRISIRQLNITEIFTKAAHTINETLVATLQDNVSTRRVSKHFRPVFTEMGLCHTYYDPEWTVYASGLNSGLTLYLHPKPFEYYFPADGFHGNLGLRVHVHDIWYPPQPKKYGKGISPGREATIALKVNNYDVRQNWERNCIDSKKIGGYYGRYTWRYCVERCLSQLIVDTCNCKPYYENFNENAPICATRVEVDCWKSVSDVFDNSEYRCDCRTECRWNDYEYLVSYSTLSSQHVSDLALAIGRRNETWTE